MSLLLKICEVANNKFIGPRVKFKGVIEEPRIFTMLYENDQGLYDNLGFYHICSPRLLLATMMVSESKSNTEINGMLNDHVAKVVPVKIDGKTETHCAKCGKAVPAQVVSKLDIIANVRTLTLR